MSSRQTPQQIADDLRKEADHLEVAARIIRMLADELSPPPPLPEFSRASHYS